MNVMDLTQKGALMMNNGTIPRQITIMNWLIGLCILALLFVSHSIINPSYGQTALRSAETCQLSAWLKRGWPDTDFTRCTVDLAEIQSGGPGKDGIPAIDAPNFIAVSQVDIAAREPVISLEIDGIARAYPLSILIWHEIVNDMINDKPIAVTYCPLCNTSIIFDRRHHDQVLDFGTTGNLRHSDLVMYDRQTESWWQQYNGDAIAGAFAGDSLTILPSRLESFAEFSARYPDGEVLTTPEPILRSYGITPYVSYDSSSFPFLFDGETPEGISPLERVVTFGDSAVALPFLQQKGSWRNGDYRLQWTAGQASALDSSIIAQGRDVGTVHVQRQEDHGKLVDVPYKVTFAFVWHAFNPDKPILGITAN